MVTRNQSIALVAGVITLIAVAAVAVALVYRYPISSTGTVKTVGCEVYGNEDLTSVIGAIQWATLSPGDYSTVTIWVKNTGTVPVVLSLESSNFVPAAAQTYLSVTWDYNGAQIAPGAVDEIVMKLSASAQTTGITQFAIDITVVATEVI